MNSWLHILIYAAVFLLIVAAVARARYELYHLAVTKYDIASDKIPDGKTFTAVFLTDLHGRRYGEENAELLRMVREQNPDFILTSGDMITAGSRPRYKESYRLHRNLLQIAPVFSAPGNHEKWLSLPESGMNEVFDIYRRALIKIGVNWLENKSKDAESPVTIIGLDIDYAYYNKVHRIFYPPEQMKKDLASPDEKRFNIILAHNPRFFKTYAGSGADLVLCGHYHGGAVRLGKLALISPQFRVFPRYSKGLYRMENTQMIVSAGCGSHKVNLRLFNQPEIVVIKIHGNLANHGNIV